jgi:hypothetical protein
MRYASLLSPALLLIAAVHSPAAGQGAGFNEDGNRLISDQFNNRIVEIDPLKNIVWTFGSGDGTLCNPGPGTIIGPNDVERLANGETLMPGTGDPGPNPPACVDNRVIIVDRNGHIVFQYGKAGVTGSGPDELNVPVFAVEDKFHNILITDQGNNRVILVNRKKHILFNFGAGVLSNPNSAEPLPNGHYLIADENNSRVLEVNRAGKIVATIGPQINSSVTLNIVAFASRLPNGDTLITDSGNNRVLEITPDNDVVFSYTTNLQVGSNPTPNPTRAIRLRNGNTLIADQFNDRILSVTPQGERVFQYGQLNKPGNGPDQLNAPYSAVVIGQYIGQAKPPK